MRKLTELSFDNTFARMPEAFYARVTPAPLSAPYLVSFNAAAAELIDLDPEEACRSEFVQYFSGSRALPGAEPLAMLYAGHQFGQYVRQLGDGRAILLGEVREAGGEKWDVQLKGAGPTPFSRGFDGRAVLRSTIREYLCGEAMGALGIPTSRALAIVGSDDPVYRETAETAAVLTRLAPSHVRFGSFEVFHYRGQHERITQLADYCILHYFPELAGAGRNKYQLFFREVVVRTARLIAKWQAVGFAHGVMNTDNMSILGSTLDYGPFGFMDDYHAGFVCNHSDHGGRYAFDQQPHIGLWNLVCLAHALLPLLSEEEATAALDEYRPAFGEHYGELMRAKLGLQKHLPETAALTQELLEILEANRVDYTNFFRSLGNFTTQPGNTNELVRDKFINPAMFDRWAVRYRERLLAERSVDHERKDRMNQTNPKYVLRNYLAETAIRQAVDERDYSEIDRLLRLLQKPYAEQPSMERYAAPPPASGKRLVVSCSS